MQPLSCPIPSELNVLKNNGFRFKVIKLPEVSFFCQDVNLPSLELPLAHFGTPLVDVPIPGDKITVGALSISFLVDASMTNYKAIQSWIIGAGFPQSHAQYQAFMRTNAAAGDRNELQIGFSDAILEILGATNNVVQSVQFINCYPSSLAPISFQTTVNDPVYVGASATFQYSYYKFV